MATRSELSDFIKKLENSHSDDQAESDTTGALNLALGYPFRSQAAKIVLLVNNGEIQVRYVKSPTVGPYDF